MGCGSSKNMDAQIAGDFFGANDSYHNREGSNHIHNSAKVTSPERPTNRVPMKSNLKTSSRDGGDEPPKQQQNKLTKTKKPRETPPLHASGGGGTPSTSTSSKKVKKATRSGGSGSSSDILTPSTTKNSSRNKESVPNSSKLTNKISSPEPGNQKAPKAAFRAPPSSESFVANPPPKVDMGTKMGTANGRNNLTSPSGPAVPSPPPPPPPVPQSAVSVPPPPPPLSAVSKASQQDPMHAIKPILLDDDDFSVAPSLATEMRSICESSKTKFDDVYQRGKKLGFGAFAMVFVGIHKPSGATYAIKQVDRSKMFWGERDALKDEINNLREVRAGPNIVQLYEVYEEQTFCYLVTELMNGGELFDRIIEKKTFSEKEARDSIRCVLEALQYMHDRRVAHRDLKPENLLLKDPKGLLPVKLADFGFAKNVEKKNGCRTLCGTPGYLAPEILERFPAYDVKCDIWSVGVILFLLLGGYLPFDDEDENRVFDRTRNGEYDFRPQFWRNISSGAKDLVTRCLTINQNKRYSARKCLEHEWMREQDDELETHSVDVEKLKKHAEQGKRKMKAAVNTLLAANRLKQLNEKFANYMDNRKQDSIVSHISFMTMGTKYGHAKFKEDSPSGKPFNDFYVVGELLGEGGHSYIYRAIRKVTKLPYTVKHIKLSNLNKKQTKTVKDEITSLKLLRGGPHIIRLFDVFEDKHETHMIFEEMKGGNILSRIVEKEVYTEREARHVCKLALVAVNYCHRKKVAHRDIKPENFVLIDEGDDSSVKLVDFAFAKKVPHEKCLKTLCGTPQYVAPEIVNNNGQGYDFRCDIWSLGVFTYLLLGGYPPFEGILDSLTNEITRGFYEFHEEYWSEISDEAKAMIRSMLQVNPDDRVSAMEALSCSWMEVEEEQLVVRDLTGAQESIRKTLQPTSKIKMAVTAMISRDKFTSIASMFNKESVDPNLLQESMGVIDEWEDETFGDLYLWGEQIGVGTFSVVHEVLHKETEEIFAAKRISRKDLHPSDAVALHDEIEALQQVTECPYIVRLYDVFDEPDFTFLVLECMKGGDLIDRIIEKRHYTEFDAKEVSRKLIMGVAYCHKKKIANRNLKPENLLLKAGSDTDVRISDFGYAKTVTFPNSLRTQCGTEGYVAPEILEHRPAYDVSCDMWSLGVIIYIVLGGYRPFRGEGEEVMRQIRYGEYKFHKRYWSHVSDDAKDLISRMLTVDPEKRITAEEALTSNWINSDEDSLGTHVLSGNMKDLRDAKQKLKGVVNTIIATNKLQNLSKFHAYKD
ncbi:serine/threonine protein kinase [Nitzschia inconspicua]|uniref:Serine/threonine protein kinase n=1 Tax=Nitzschia inconspicua TaxID=303405 RepID=A0A9K3L2G6_9STRA|nr:serine/threonine protein kinase [Nitzschia inconspicua]